MARGSDDTGVRMSMQVDSTGSDVDSTGHEVNSLGSSMSSCPGTMAIGIHEKLLVMIANDRKELLRLGFDEWVDMVFFKHETQ